MMKNSEVIARELRDAYAGEAIPSLRDCVGATDADTAYAIRAINTHHWVEAGRKIVGRKAGLTAKAVQQQLGVDQPDFGVLFSDMRIDDGGALDVTQTIQPIAEAEIAFVLGTDLPDPSTTASIVAQAVSTVHAAIEIVDSRIIDWNITFADTVADNGSSAFFVLSDQGHAISDLDLYTAGMVMEVNGKIASTGVGAAALGHPLEAAAWLARTLAAQGEPLKAGDIMLAGALGPMVSIAPGDSVRAIVGGIGECCFSLSK